MVDPSSAIPMLPPRIVEQSETIHKGRLWAWAVQPADGGWHLAIAIANLPCLRSVKGIELALRQDAEMAAEMHNHRRAPAHRAIG